MKQNNFQKELEQKVIFVKFQDDKNAVIILMCNAKKHNVKH